MARILFFTFLITLTGCANLPTSKTSSSIFSKPTVVRHEACYETPHMKVFQVMDYGILAHLCPTDFPSYYDNVFDACAVKGDVVFMPVKKSQNDFVDDQRITLPEELCFAPDGVFKYSTVSDREKTVRKITIIEAVVPNPELKKETEK